MHIKYLNSAEKDLKELESDIQHHIKQSLNLFSIGGKKIGRAHV